MESTSDRSDAAVGIVEPEVSGKPIWAIPATELAAAIRRKEISPVEVTETLLARWR